MNPDLERQIQPALRKILDAGGIPCTYSSLEALWSGESTTCVWGLSSIIDEFHASRSSKQMTRHIPSVSDIAKICDELKQLTGKASEILTRIRYQIVGTLTLNEALRARDADPTKIAAALHSLQYAAAAVAEVAREEAAKRRLLCRRTKTKTDIMVFYEIYRLYCFITGMTAIGNGGPLYRFVKESITLINDLSSEQIKLPTPDSFRKRLTAWKREMDLDYDFSIGKKALSP
jgi:hypothetical protein